MRKVLAVFGIFVILLGIIGCWEIDYSRDPELKQSKQTQQLMDEVNKQIGLPNIVNFQQKKIMKMIYEECDKENLICYAYIIAKYSGKLIFLS